MNIDAQLIEVFDTQQISDAFRKREFVVEYAENPQYPEFLKFELIQTNCEQLDDLNKGDKVRISFNLKGRKWTDPSGNVKYFNSLQAWRLEKVDNSSNETPSSPNQEWIGDSFSEDDDLPF
jgi:single-stranded DNA-binding protein